MKVHYQYTDKDHKKPHHHYVTGDFGEFWPTYQIKGILPQLARFLISEGYDPKEPLEAYRGEHIVFEIVPLERWAAISITEGVNSTTLQKSKYVPLDKERAYG